MVYPFTIVSFSIVQKASSNPWDTYSKYHGTLDYTANVRLGMLEYAANIRCIRNVSLSSLYGAAKGIAVLDDFLRP